jgi:hypothetical protein
MPVVSQSVTPALTQVSQTIKEQELYILTMRSKAIAAQKRSRFARAKQL